MAKYYAQVDETGRCFAVSQLSGEIDAPNVIEIDGMDDSLPGKRLNGETGEWEAE